MRYILSLNDKELQVQRNRKNIFSAIIEKTADKYTNDCI